MPRDAHRGPFKISIVDGEVVFLGEGLGFAMTPDAARRTCRRLAAILERERRGRSTV